MGNKPGALHILDGCLATEVYSQHSLEKLYSTPDMTQSHLNLGGYYNLKNRGEKTHSCQPAPGGHSWDTRSPEVLFLDRHLHK